MSRPAFIHSHDPSQADLRSVYQALRHTSQPLTALGIAQATKLSTLVVVPALDHLEAARDVARRAVDDPENPSGRWVYQLTIGGRRRSQKTIARATEPSLGGVA